ncbi:MAG: phosphotransferase [Anaerolineaceae bacterium]|nr:phosphotransferase [Anaerolineaceae bacterium]
MDYPTIETVTDITHKHAGVLGLGVINHVESALIGQGEANLNVLVKVNQSHNFNLRIGLRDKESERTLQSEFDMLQLAPEGIGPGVFVVDFSRAEMAAPYMLLEYVAGDLKKTWDMTDLKAHAHTLARLHERKFDQHGAIGHLSDAPYDFLRRFDVAVEYWQTNHPHLLEIPIVQRLLPPIRHFVTVNNSLFTSLRRFTIVHGDAHPQNILFDGNRLCYIDWEWAVIGDPACDIAMIGWDIATGWQMELTGESLDSFLDTYLALEPDDALRQRRDVWMVYTMYFDQIYHRTQIPTDSTGKQLYTVQQIETYLSQRFL